MDILMPIVDGLEATRRLKADPRTSALPVLCISAKASGADADAGLAAGCDAYIVKPLKRIQLLEAIRDLLIRTGAIGPEDTLIPD